MKKHAVLLFSLFIAASLAAQEARPVPKMEFATPPAAQDVHRGYADVIQSIPGGIEGLRIAGKTLRSNVVLEGPEAGFVFPIVGSTAAAGGLFFRSETVIVNRRNRAQSIYLYYFPAGGGSANCTRPAKTMVLDAQKMYLWTDFVADVFNAGGIGAAIVLPVTSSGSIDSSAAIDGNSRIWTPQPGTDGTTSQNFPSMSLQVPGGGQSSFGLRMDEFYRTNWGIFNYDTKARTFDLIVNGFRGSNQFSRVIDACSMSLSLLPGGPYGSLELLVNPRDNGGLYFSFGSSVDNSTGDSWSVVGRSY